jgi:hypothetical protein
MTSVRALVVLVALAGCDKVLGLKHLSDAAPIDPDASRFMDAPPPGIVCAGTLDHVCEQEVDLGAMSISDHTFDTDDMACQYTTMDSPPVHVCVIAAATLTISGHVRATGSHPLVLFSSGALQVTAAAVIDVSSMIGDVGAAANDGACASTFTLEGPDQTATINSAGGGAGGSFNGKGGDGGSNGNSAAIAFPGQPSLKFIRGGCIGGNGGFDFNLMHAGVGGPSGGAVYLMAAGPIDIAGKVLANGGGGAGGSSGAASDFAGGGGGGTGGAIVIDGKQVDILPTAVVLAAGGGGGAGEDGLSAGGNGGTATATAGGAGGTVPIGSNGGVGGLAGFTNHDGRSGVVHGGSQGGSGGGGGADGFIRVFPTTPPQGIVVPAPS